METTDPLWGKLLVVILLILVNAFFAASEIAVISLNENKLKLRAEEGDKKAGQLLGMLQNSSAFLSTIQICITLGGFLASAFAADTFAERFTAFVASKGWGVPLPVINTLSLILITVILSYFTLVFGELVPKRAAMQKTDLIARYTVGTVNAMSRVFKPVIWLLSKSTNAVLRLIGIDPDAENEEVTEDEIRMMVDIGGEKGAIEENERDMIENIFEFNNTTAARTMTHRTDVSAIWISDTDEEITKLIVETGLSRFPVYNEDLDDIIGTLSTREYLLNTRQKQPKAMKDLLRPAYFVPETVRTDVLFRDMQKKKIHMAIVVDEYGGTSGIITMEDLLEEIVGNIYDEFDPQDESEITQLTDDTWRVSGSVSCEALAETLDVEIPESEDYDTLGGLVFSCLTTIPEDGSHPEVDVCGLHITVDELTDRRVEWARVQKLLRQQAASEKEDK